MIKIKPTLIGGIPNRLSETNKNTIIYVDQYGINLDHYNHNSYDLEVYWQIEGRGVIKRRENNMTFNNQPDHYSEIWATEEITLPASWVVFDITTLMQYVANETMTIDGFFINYTNPNITTGVYFYTKELLGSLNVL